jgi:hypothetical protein
MRYESVQKHVNIQGVFEGPADGASHNYNLEPVVDIDYVGFH